MHFTERPSKVGDRNGHNSREVREFQPCRRPRPPLGRGDMDMTRADGWSAENSGAHTTDTHPLQVSARLTPDETGA